MLPPTRAGTRLPCATEAEHRRAALSPRARAPQCFEGMKAYKDAAGRVRMFRPDLNMARLNASCAR